MKMPRRKRDDNGFAERGGYMEAKKSKLEEQFFTNAAKHSTTSDVDEIFSSIAIFVNGYTIPSADEMKLLMIKHGGIYHQYYRSQKTTHVIASNLPDTKIKQLKGIKVVKPEWIVDSISKGKLLDYRLYLLYTNQSKTQPKLFLNTNLQSSNSASLSSELTDSDSKENNRKPLRIFCSEDTKLSNNITNSKEPDDSTTETKDTIGYREVLNQHEIIKDHNFKKNVAKTASEASFLSEFYSNSRLHHISTMGAIFKQYVSNLRTESSGELKGVDDFKEWISKQPSNKQSECFNNELISIEDKKYKSLIMHIDMDCFFVSVGIRKRPDLQGLPVAVTHAKANSQGIKRDGMDRSVEFNLYKQRTEEKFKSKINKTKIEDSGIEQIEMKPWSDRVEGINESNSMSEIASCNYEARKAGLKNGMFMGQALNLCPNLKTIPYDFEAYKEVSYTLYNTVASYTLNIEAVSCDEMFADCTELLNSTLADPMQLASFLRQKIKERTGCSCSTGFGSNRLQARLATKKAKPDGQFYLAPEDVMVFMQTVNVNDIPGVGHATSYKLSQLGINTCLDLQKMPLTKLQAEFGKKTGDTLFKNSRGNDDRALTFGQVRKSVSAEVNYGIRFENQTEADTFLKQLANEVHFRLQEVNKAAKCITLKLMVKAKDAPEESAKFLGHGVCDHTTKSSTLATPTSDSKLILREVLSLSKQLNINPKELRGIGIQLSRLDDITKHTKISKDAIDKFLVPKIGESSCMRKQDKYVQNVQITNVPNSTVPASAHRAPVSINQFFKSRKSLKEMKKLEVNNEPPLNCAQETLDKDVLAALPEDIRQEILREYGLNENYLHASMNKNEVKSCDSKELIETCSPQVEPNTHLQDLRKKLTLEEHSQSPIDDSVFLQCLKLEQDEGKIDSTNPVPLSTYLSLTEIRTLIREWVSSESSPQMCDINMLKDYLQQLVLFRQLENLDIALRCLHRCIANRNNEEWRNTYFSIVNKVQDVMLTIYGAKLFVQNNF